jgi:hypothetical protein
MVTFSDGSSRPITYGEGQRKHIMPRHTTRLRQLLDGPDGLLPRSVPGGDGMLGFDEFNELIGLDEHTQLEQRYQTGR